MISIVGLDKAEVLAALYNASHPQGMGFLHADAEEMTSEIAQQLLDVRAAQGRIYFDYLKGRVIKVDLTLDSEFEEYLYDRDNGSGAAQRVIDALRIQDKAAS